MFSRLDRIPACDRQTDGRTDGQTSCRAMYMRRAVKTRQLARLVYQTKSKQKNNKKEQKGSQRLQTVASCRMLWNRFNSSVSEGNCSATSNNMKLVRWPLMGGLLHLVQ